MKLTLSNTRDPDHADDPLSNRASNLRARNSLFFAAGALLYWALAVLVPYFHGLDIVRLTPFFVGAAGYFLGFGAGVTASATALVVHTLVFNGAGYHGPLAALQVNPAANVGILLIGPLMGRMRAVKIRARTEAARRRETERYLRESESIVAGRWTIEKALSASEHRCHQLFEDDLTGDFVATPGGNYIVVNPAFVRMFGFDSAQDALSSSASSLFPNGRAWDAFLGRLAAEERLVNSEEELLGKDGSPVFVVGNFVGGFDKSGSLTEIKGYVFDNTARKSLEERWAESQGMVAIGRLASGIAHDFNNSLTSISGYNELLMDKLDPGSPVHRYSQEVMKAAGRAADLTRRLQGIGGRHAVEPTLLDVNTILFDLETILRRTIGEEIELSTAVDTAPCLIEAAPSAVETSLLNLALAARDAMADGGSLTIRTNVMTVDDADLAPVAGIGAGRYVVVTVADADAIMDAESATDVVDPFIVSTNGVATTGRKGGGPELSAVYHAVAGYGGHLRVVDGPRGGPTFLLYFPAVKDPAPTPAPSEKFLGPSQGSERVLVAEDDPAIQRLIQDVLLDKGYQVLVAVDGKAALEAAGVETGPIDLLITDMVMPQMNGRELAAELRARHRRMKVLYISGYIGAASVKVAELGPDTSFLSKPFSSEALARKIRLLIDSPPPHPTIPRPERTQPRELI